ncbi:MAG: HIT family protein [Candidatus Thorarchaeota archaeon]
MRREDCIFCKIVKKIIPSKIIFENELTLAFLDISPISKGHTIIIPKNHYSTLEDIPEDELVETFKVVKKIATRIYENLSIDGYNILQNNYPAAGQVINHYHIHIIPRKDGDNKFKLEIPRNQAIDADLDEVLRKLRDQL